MILISCPELLKHFLFQINSNKEEGKPGIRRAMWEADPALPEELLGQKDSLGVLPLQSSFKRNQCVDRLFKCYSQANLVPTPTHQLPCGWEN